jgi:hypothetical protein
MSPDPWTGFLDWLTTVLMPTWSELIVLLPYVVVGTIVGPILMIVVLMWGWYLIKRRRGHVRRGEIQPVAAPRDTDGLPVFPPNAPYCEQHALVYPPRTKTCQMNGDPLSVTCPVDGTVRDASIDTCGACGTTYKLGSRASAVAVITTDGPPEGGAAIA